jgi:hypothetical protein
MSDSKSENINTVGENTEKHLSWLALIIRIIVAFSVYAVVSQIYFPFETEQHSLVPQNIAFTLGGYSMMFFGVYIATSSIVLMGKIPKNNRSKPVQNFLNSSLIATIIIVGMLVYGGWYSNQNSVPSSSTNSTYDDTRKDDFLTWIKTQSSESLAKSAAVELAKLLPMQINSLTSVYGVTSVGNTITMRVKVLTTKSNFISLLRKDGDTLSTYITKFQNMIHNMGCTQKVNRLYIEQGVIYKYLVSDIDLNFLFEASVESCT